MLKGKEVELCLPRSDLSCDTCGADDRRDHCNLLLACSIPPDHEKLSQPICVLMRSASSIVAWWQAAE